MGTRTYLNSNTNCRKSKAAGPNDITSDCAIGCGALQREPRQGRSFVEVHRIAWQAVGLLRRRYPPHERDDLTQDVTVRLLISAQRQGVRPEGLPRSYIRQIARSVVIDHWRRRRRRPEGAIAEESNGVWEEYIGATCDGFSALELSQHTERCLSQLQQSRKQAVSLYLLGYSREECASKLGASLKQTENLLYRGLKDLRIALTNYGFGLNDAQKNASMMPKR